MTWDLTNEWHSFRDAWWVEQMGTYLKSIDPYQHLISTHGRGDFPWSLSQRSSFALYQLWDENGGYDAMLKRREAQAATGRALPQINEEYGYQDTYPVKWGGNRRPPARNADSRRRLAWEIERYRHLVDFFESIPYWKLSPVGGHVLAEPGIRYVAYAPHGEKTAVQLTGGRYRVRRYNPQTGAWFEQAAALGPAWISPRLPDEGDIVFLLESQSDRQR